MPKRSEDARLRDLLRMIAARRESCEFALPTLKNMGHFAQADHVQHRLDVYVEVEAMIERKLSVRNEED